MPDKQQEGDVDQDDQQVEQQEDVQIDTEWQVRHREDGGEKR
jgi:hypothetical protein